MNYQFYFIFALISLFGLLGVAASEDEDDQEEIHFNKLLRTVFYRNYENDRAISINVFLRLLNDLKKIYMKRGEMDNAKDMDALIEVSRFTRNMCDLSKITQINTLIREYSPYYVVQYLRHYRSEQFELCEPELVNNLKRALTQFTEDEIKSLQKLKDEVEFLYPDILFQNRYRGVQRDRLPKGLAAYLKFKGVPMKTKMAMIKPEIKRKFVDGFERYILNLCDKANKILESPMEVFFTLDGGQELEKLDYKTQEWNSIARICRVTLNERNVLIGEAYDASKKLED